MNGGGGIDMDHAKRQRDRRLRRKILMTLHLSQTSPRAGLNGRTLRDLVDGVQVRGQRFEDDNHALQLVRELVAKGLAAEEPLQRRRGQTFGLDFVFTRITAKGSSLVNETIDPDPDVDDDRVPEDGD